MRRPRITTILTALLTLAILGDCSRDSTGPATVNGASLALSTIAARAAVLTGDGVDTTTITVTPRDANGAAITLASNAVLITASRGSLRSVKQNSDGTFAALLTAPNSVGLDSIFASINGQRLHRSLLLPLVPGLSAASSLFGAIPPRILADGKSTALVFFEPRDAQGNTMTDVAVTMTTTRGTLSPVMSGSTGPFDYGDDGHYFAILTSTASVDSAIVSVQVAGQPFGAPIIVQFVLHD